MQEEPHRELLGTLSAMTAKKKLLIVANTPSENTRALANAALRGASHPDIENIDVRLKQPLQAGPEDVLACDAILLGSTENFGYMSGLMKDFFERIYYPCLEEKQGLPYSIYIRAGLDGTGTENAMQKIITGLKWTQVQPLLLCKGEYQEAFIEQVEELGMAMAAGLEANVF